MQQKVAIACALVAGPAIVLLDEPTPGLDVEAAQVVTGELVIASNVEPSVLTDRLARVYNLGEITCTREHMGAIQARLGLNEGDMIDSAGVDTVDESANAGYLVL